MNRKVLATFTLTFIAMAIVNIWGCRSDDNPTLSPDLTRIRIKERPCEMLEYNGQIGGDFDTALDSLRKLKGISSEIIKEPLEVLFDNDNRLFYGIVFYRDCGMYSDVLDTKGNYYIRTWYCSDEQYKDNPFEGKWCIEGIEDDGIMSDYDGENKTVCFYSDGRFAFTPFIVVSVDGVVFETYESSEPLLTIAYYFTEQELCFYHESDQSLDTFIYSFSNDKRILKMMCKKHDPGATYDFWDASESLIGRTFVLNRKD